MNRIATQFDFEIWHVQIDPAPLTYLFHFNAVDLGPDPKACPLFVALWRLHKRRLLSLTEIGEIFGAAVKLVASKEARK